jgi:hypothetical protein
VAFDGLNWWSGSSPIVPVNTPSTTHQWLASYNSSTGAFTLSQPSFSDLSGNIATGQLPTSGLSTTITTAKLTTGGAEGSMQFQNGILILSTPAT